MRNTVSVINSHAFVLIENDTDEILTILEDGDLAYAEIFLAKIC